MSQRSGWARLAGLAGVLLLASGCGGGEGDTGAESPAARVVLPAGRVVFAGDVLCAPGRRWEHLPETGNWRFHDVGSILCAVTRQPGEPLVLRLAPDGTTALFQYEISWDGELLVAEPVALGEGVHEIELSPERLTPGRHELRLRRRYRAVEGSLPNWQSNRFSELGLSGGGTATFRSAPASHAYLADFLELGLGGLGKEKWGGTLFVGPAAAPVEVETAVPGAVHLRVENASSAPASFTVRGGRDTVEVTVGPGERAALELGIPAGVSRLALAVEGAPNGLFLWSFPEIDPERSLGSSRPPLVLVTLDTTRRDALSPYGGSPEMTPEIAAFARAATVFERAYSTSSWTLPSHASMMTGLYPSRHGAGLTTGWLDDPQVTLAELLGEVGYWSLGFAGGQIASSGFGMGKGFRVFRDPDEFETRGDRLTDHVEETLDSLSQRPLFLFVNYFDPHAAYQAPEKLQRRLDLDRRRRALRGHPIWQRFDRGSMDAWREIIDGEAPATPEILDYARAAYLAEVAFMDLQLGRLFDLLRRHGIYDEAMIVLVADHGELLGEGGYFSHAGRLDPELVEVPMIVKWPGQREGRRVETLVSVVDLFPTLLAAAGLEAPPSDGIELPREGEPASRRFLLMEEHETPFHPLPAGLRVAKDLYGIQRREARRLVWPEGQECARRGGERWRPETCSGEPAAALARLVELLGKPPEGGEAGGALSAEERQALEALGYL